MNMTMQPNSNIANYKGHLILTDGNSRLDWNITHAPCSSTPRLDKQIPSLTDINPLSPTYNGHSTYA